MGSRETFLAQQMRDLQIHHHQIELRRLKASSGDSLAVPFLRALKAIRAAFEIVETYIIPSELPGFGREPSWSLVVFSEHPLPAMWRIALVVAAQEASESAEITVEIYCWSENALELAEAMATGIRICSMSCNPHQEEQ